MHERAGDTLYPMKKIIFKRNNNSNEKHSDEQKLVEASEQSPLPEDRKEQSGDERNSQNIRAESDK